MNKAKYRELSEGLLNRYCSQWPDFDITIPSFEEANRQERDGEIILESEENGLDTKKKIKGKVMEDINQKIKDIFGKKTNREELDERIYWEEVEAEDKAKKEKHSLTLSEKRLADEATLDETEGVNHSLDQPFALAFGNARKTSNQLRELKESLGSESEGVELLETVLVDAVDSNGSKPFKFSGRAFRVDVVNQNGRRYKRTLAENALKEVQGQHLSICAGHPKPDTTDPTIVVGKVVFGIIDNDGWIGFEAQLSDTSKGLDLQKLLQDKCIGNVSLRSRGHTRTVKEGGEQIEEVISLKLKGLDLVLAGSFEKAEVTSLA